MKRDELEKFIIQHRNDFDIEEPPTALWSKIEAQLEPSKGRIVWLPYFKRAAAVAALLILGFSAGVLLSRNSQSVTMVAIQKVNPDFSEAERYYTSLIKQNLAQLEAYPTHKKEVLADLAQLDRFSEELLRDLATAPVGAEDRIVAELIQTYRTKISILEKVLDSIQSSKSKMKITRDEKEI
jgi:hypothetical protein